jgi:hypothetical protein
MQSLHEAAEPSSIDRYATADLNALRQQDRHCVRGSGMGTTFRFWSTKLDECRSRLWNRGWKHGVTIAHFTPMPEDMVADAMQAAVRRLTEAARRPGGQVGITIGAGMVHGSAP